MQEDGKQPVEYVLTGESGPDHNKQFEVEVRINGIPAGNGAGHTKKPQNRLQPTRRSGKSNSKGEICI